MCDNADVGDVEAVMPDSQLLAVAVVRRRGALDDLYAPAARAAVTVGHGVMLPQVSG